MALSHVVSGIYSMSKNFLTLKSGPELARGHLSWYNSIDWVMLPITVHSNYVPTVFEISDFKKCHDLEIGVKGHSRSSEPTRKFLQSCPFHDFVIVLCICGSKMDLAK